MNAPTEDPQFYYGLAAMARVELYKWQRALLKTAHSKVAECIQNTTPIIVTATFVAVLGNFPDNVAGAPTYVCHAGYHLLSFSQQECSKCPAGRYSSGAQLLLRCLLCDLGKFQK